MEGRILRSSADSVWVEGSNEQPLELKREDIVDVTHPGSWEIGIGTGLLTLGVALVAVGGALDRDSCTQSDRERGECGGGTNPDSVFAYIGALSVAVPGVVLLFGGIDTHNESGLRYVPPDLQARGAAPLNAKRVQVSFEF